LIDANLQIVILAVGLLIVLLALGLILRSRKRGPEKLFLAAYEEDRWDEALQLYATHELASSERASKIAKLIEQNREQPGIVFLDVEADPNTGTIWEIGAVRKRGMAVLREFHTFVATDSAIPRSRLIEPEKRLYDRSPAFEVAKRSLLEFVGETMYIAGHNIRFDIEYLQEPLLSSRVLVDTLELGFLTWPARFSHTLSALTGKPEVHRALEDARMSSELFEASLESFRKLAASRQKIVLAAFRDDRAAKLVAETVGIEPASQEQTFSLILPTVLEQRKSMSERLSSGSSMSSADTLTKEVASRLEDQVTCMLTVDGCMGIEDYLRSGLSIATKGQKLNFLAGPRDLVRIRATASRIRGIEWPTPDVAVRSLLLARLCLKRMRSVVQTLSERSKDWRRAFLVIALWAMDNPECYVEEFSYWFRQQEEWSEVVLLELSQHMDDCGPDCGLSDQFPAQLLLMDSSAIDYSEGPVIVPDSHNFEAIVTRAQTLELSSDLVGKHIDVAIRVVADETLSKQLKNCKGIMDDLTSRIVQFVRNRDLCVSEEHDRSSLRILDFYQASSDWVDATRAYTLLKESLSEIATRLDKIGHEYLSETISKSSATLSKFFSYIPPGRVRWITIQRDEKEVIQWTYRDAPIDVKAQLEQLIKKRQVIFITDCAPKAKASKFLLRRWGLEQLPVHQLTSTEKKWPKTISIAFLPRPTRLNLLSYLTKLTSLAAALAKPTPKIELAVSSYTILKVVERTLSRSQSNVRTLSRRDNVSRRRAVARAAEISTKHDASFVFLDQTALLRKKERKVGTNLLLLEKIPSPVLADPVTAARFEALGGGLDAYESYMLPQSALALTEVIAYAGGNGIPLAICDSRLAQGGFASMIGEYLPITPTWCETPSALETSLGLPAEALGSFNTELFEKTAKILDEVLKEQGLSYARDLSEVDPTAYLRALFGHDSFRLGQEEIIRQVLRREDTFAVMPTGYGKSLCYQIPAIAFSLIEEGLTLIVSPLQALMRDQVQSLHRHGILRATYINASVDPNERSQRLRGIRNGWYNLVYLAPEQLRNPGTLEAIQSRQIALVVIDEAHCLSQWGHDFRPDYMHLTDFLNNLSPRPVVAAFTATASEQVVQDVTEALGIKKPAIRLSPRRQNISLETIRIKGESRSNLDTKKKESLLAVLRDLGSSKNGIIYCSWTRTTEEVAAYLKEHATELDRSPEQIAFFHGKIADDLKAKVQDRFIGKTEEGKTNPVKIVVATNAFGLGVDKDDIHFVIHYDVPGSIEAYYQEVGRAGRNANLSAIGLLMFSEPDLDKQRLLFRYVDEKDIVQVHETMLGMRTSPDGLIYVSDSDLARDTGLDEVAIRVAIYQLEKNGYLERGPNAIGPMTLKARPDSTEESLPADSDCTVLWEHLKHRLSSSEWRTIQLQDLTLELDWQVRRVDFALRKILRHNGSPVLRQQEFEYALPKLTSQKDPIESVRNIQNRLLDRLDQSFDEFRGGGWVRIRGESWPTLVQGTTFLGERLSRVDCAKFFRIWADLGIVWHRQELSNDAVRLLVPVDRARSMVQATCELDSATLEELRSEDRPKSFDIGSLTHLAPDVESINSSLRRLRELGLISISRCATHGTCMSLKLKRKTAMRPAEINIAHLRRVQRQREHKLESMASYSNSLLSSDRWRFIEDYFAGKLLPKPVSDILAGLNPQQAEAVAAPSGYLLINAGAGTGKTETVARRILYVTEELSIPPGQLLAMTFSRAGVAQLRERMKRVMPNRRIDIRTYHSLAYEILRSHAGEEPLWIKPGFEVEPTETLMGRIRQTLDSLQDSLDPGERVAMYSKAMQKLQSLRNPPRPGEIEDSLQLEIDRKTVSGVHLNKVYKSYVNLMKRINAIDYSFMISSTVDLLRARPEVLRDYERRVAYLVIDEYQDTTPIQDELLSLLSSWYGNLCVVGDSDQTIFAWSNADVKNILEFAERREGVKQVNLEVNYRSTQNILDVANETIVHNRERIPKRLTAHRKIKGPHVVVHYADDADDVGANYISQQIKKMISDGAKPESIVVLTKTNDQLSRLIASMQAAGIRVKTPEEQVSITRNPKVQQVLNAMEKLAEVRPNLSAYSCYAETIANSGIRDVPQTFADMIREFDTNSEDNTGLAFLNFVRATTALDSRVDAQRGAVNLMTIHKAKGLEFDTVFLTYLKCGSFPRFDVNIEEERRVFYVGLTRARDNLHVICSSTRPSQFVREIDDAKSSIRSSGQTSTYESSYRSRRRT
jgi:RecQ family ATP-dependent DNA helicase